MLAAEFALAVAPAAGGNHSGNALVDAADIDRDRRAEARADHADTVVLDVGILGKEGQRVARGLHLFQADQMATLAFAVAAAGHVETQRHVAELLEHLAGLEHVVRARLLPKPCMTMKAGPALARFHAVRHADGAGELAALGNKRDFGVGHSHYP